MDAPFAVAQPVPRWLPLGAAATDRLAHVGFWLSKDVAFLQQFDRTGELTPACRTFDTRTRAWRKPPGGCLSSDFSYLAEVNVGPGGLLALHSSAEGRCGLSVIRYELQAGQSETKVPSIVLEGASSVSVRFSPDGSSVELVSPCVLEGKPPPTCENFESVPTWHLYSVPVAGGALQSRRADLPPGAVLDPKRDRFAWPRDGEVCVGDPRDASPKCAAVPGR